LAGWTGGGFAEVCAPDIQYEDPLAVDPLRGIDALEDHARDVRDAMPDLALERTGATLTNGAFACIPWRAKGTHKPTNRFISLTGLHYLELSDDQIRRARGFFDLYDAGAQLGYLPTRGGIGESVLLFLRGFGLR
jgi:hypothetical protein